MCVWVWVCVGSSSDKCKFFFCFFPVQKLDQHSKHSPPRRLDRKPPIFLPPPPPPPSQMSTNRMNFQTILLGLQKNNLTTITNDDDNNHQSLKIELREFRHQLQRWEQYNRELETKFVALRE